MIPAGTQFRAVVVGAVGPFHGAGAQPVIAQRLTGAGIVVESLDDVVPNLLDQVIQLDVFARPFQDTIIAHTAIDYTAVEDVQSQIALAYSGALGTWPTSISIDQLAGLPTGQATPQQLASPTGAIANAAAQLGSFTTSTLVILGVVIVGAIALVAWGPNTGRLLNAAGGRR